MKAIEITRAGDASLVDRAVPEVVAGDVLLRINTVGYCGTDLSTFRGANPLVSYPRIPGHEVAATVVSMGEGVDGWAEGESALVFPYSECGECAACLVGRFNCCKSNQTLGVQRDGLLSELGVVPANKLLRGEGLTRRELALVEPLTVGAHAVRRGLVNEGEYVAVFGCGAIGLGAIAAASQRGASVIAIDLDDDKLARASACGATFLINSATSSLSTEVASLTDGRGPAVVIEAVGRPETFLAAVDLVSFAGRVVYVGYSKLPVEYETKWFVMKELDIRGSRNASRDDFDWVIGMLQAGVVPTERIVTHTTKLQDAAQALASWAADPGRVTKIHVEVTE